MDFSRSLLSIRESTIQCYIELNTFPVWRFAENSMIIFNKQVFRLLCNSIF